MTNSDLRTGAPALLPESRFDAKRALLVGVAALVGGYLAASLGYLLTLRPASVVFLWPPSGLVLATLVLTRRVHWPPILAGALIGNAIADSQNGAGLALAAAGSIANVLESLVAALVLDRLAGTRMRLNTLRDIGAVVLGAVVVSNALTALAGAFVLQRYTHASLWRAWFNWWTGDGMGMLILFPVVITWAHVLRSGIRVSKAWIAETILLVLGVSVAAVFLLTGASGARGLSGHAYLVFPLLLWAGIRTGPAGAATVTTALTGVVAWFAANGALLHAGNQPTQVLALYTYLSLASLSSLVPAAVLSEREEATRDLRDSESRFREIADLINEAFFVVDIATRRCLYVNPGWGTIWGRPLADGYDANIWFDSIHPDDRPALVAAMRENEQGKPTTNLFRVLRPGGEVRWVRGRAFPVRDGAGVVRRVVGVSTDVTELRDAEQRFVQAQKMEAVGRLASGVAHDFNNLITVIFGEAEAIGASQLSNESRDSIAQILLAAERAASLTRQLLAFSRKEIIEPRVIDLNGAVRDTAKMLQRLIGEDVTLDIRFAPESLGVFVDPGQVEQLITNLAVNSRDAMPNGGTLTLTTSAAHAPGGWPAPGSGAEHAVIGWVELAVTDTGTGMREDVIASAFEPFFTTKPQGSGSGLGLATCHGIVTRAGGRIDISSAIGKGTTVRVHLPRVAITTSPPEPTAWPVQPRGTERILVVEDDAAVRNVTARVLRAQGYHVLEARDATAALHQLHLAAPAIDLLLTDVVLPGISGRNLADMVRTTWPEVRTLFVTGYTEDVVLREKLLAKDATVLQKPFSADALGRAVREVLDRAL